MTADSDIQVVMIVDDEDMVLASIESFLTLETEYDVRTFSSAAEALEHASAHPVDLVVSDYLMPEMDGITFLGRMRQLNPEAPRVLLTGYADKENAIKAINEVGLFQYLEKPWDNDRLKLVLRNGLEKKQLLFSLQSKIAQINSAYADLSGIQQQLLKAFS